MTLSFAVMFVYFFQLCKKYNEENLRLTKLNEEYEQIIASLQSQLDLAEEDYQQVSEELSGLESDLRVANKEINGLTTTIVGLSSQIESLNDRVKYVFNGDWHYDYTEEDVELLAGVMYGENYISGRWEMMLTGSVVLNRVLSDRFPNTIKEVIYQVDGGFIQYAPRTKRLIGSAEVREECYELARLLLEYGPVAPEMVVYQAHFNQGNIYWEWKGEQFCY